MPYVTYMKPLTVSDIAKKQTEYIDSLILRIKYLKKILPILKVYDGKKITKRIETACKALLAEDNTFTLVMDKPYSFGKFQIMIWGGKLKYEARITFDIGKDNFDYAEFVKDNDIVTLSTNIAMLHVSISKIPEFVDRYNTILAASQKLVNDSTEYYQLEYCFDIVINSRN